MENRLLVVKRVLEALDIPVSIETVAERIMVQKAIYLAQRAGIDLGYSYGWYRRGPYSPRLTHDYFELRDRIAIEADAEDPRQLDAVLLAELRRLRPVFSPPPNFPLPKHRWLELVASIAYLAEDGGEPSSVDEIIAREKPALAPHIAAARRALEEFPADH